MPLGFLKSIGRGVASAAPGVGRAAQQSFGSGYRQERRLDDNLERERKEKEATRSFLSAVAAATDAGQIRTMIAQAPTGVSETVLQSAATRADDFAEKNKAETKKRDILATVGRSMARQRVGGMADDLLDPSTTEDEASMIAASHLGSLRTDADEQTMRDTQKLRDLDRIEAEIGADPLIRSLSAATPLEAESQKRIARLQDDLSKLEEAGGAGEIVQGLNGSYKLKVTKPPLQKLGKGDRFGRPGEAGAGGGGAVGFDPEEYTKAVEFAETKLTRGDFTPDQAVESINSKVNLDPDREAALKTRFASFILRPLTNLGVEQIKKIGGASSVQEVAERALGSLDDPKIIVALGRIPGAKTKVENWLTGGATMPEEVRDLLASLGFTIDFLARKQSGAALTTDEINFYGSLIGTSMTSPRAIRQNLISAIEIMESEKQAFYQSALRIAEGGQVAPETQKTLDGLRFKSKYAFQGAGQNAGAVGALPQTPKRGDKFVFDEGPATFNGNEWVLD